MVTKGRWRKFRKKYVQVVTINLMPQKMRESMIPKI